MSVVLDRAIPDDGGPDYCEVDVSRGIGISAIRSIDPEKLTEEQITLLKKHTINLNRGRLSSEGPVHTTEQDLKDIFGKQLTTALKAAQAQGKKLKILVWAHGGLVPESSSLEHVLEYHQGWIDVDVYPIYFIWRTGFWTAVSSILGGDDGTRAFPDFAAPTDWLVEKSAHFPGVKVWGEMKEFARLGVDPDGGARLAATLLSAFIKKAGANNVELYALGHSAGACFHSWFIPTALDLGVPGFKELYLLAPAITVQEFETRLAPLIGGKVKHCSMFTMKEEAELSDNCFRAYRKSLLYLISRSLEPKMPTPILGLEESLLASPKMRTLFGLRGSASDSGEIIFSPNQLEIGPGASNSTKHGDFDNDHTTLNSVACRITRRNDIAVFKRQSNRSLSLEEALGESPVIPAQVERRNPVRRALCIGIDDYPSAPLSGCVNDARLWREKLTELGFEVGMLTDGQATRAGITNEIRELIRGSRAGDVLVLQYSGHGTHVEDLDGDEEDGRDEALVPHDYQDGQFLIDDDLGSLLDLVPPGVNFTCFMDCCHSGSNTRVLGQQAPPLDSDERIRFLPVSEEIAFRHRAVRESEPTIKRSRSYAGKPEILFAACRPDQTAKESGGHGYFSRRVVPLLHLSNGRINHESFNGKIRDGFPLPPSSQEPILDCDDNRRSEGLLQPRTGGMREGGETVAVVELSAASSQAAPLSPEERSLLVETMRDYLKLLSQ